MDRFPAVFTSSNPTNFIPGHGASALHCNDARLLLLRVPVTGPQVISESWKRDVSQPPVAPEKDVHCVICAMLFLTFVIVKSRKAVQSDLSARIDERVSDAY